MRIEVYCDEAYPDLLSSQKPQARHMLIGSLWLRAEDRTLYKNAIHKLRNQYKIGGEFKWRKVSPSRIKFYKALINWFCEQGENLRFRCIAIDNTQVNLIRFHENDQELGFYKFYYQLLQHWIHDFNEYSVFCDYKKNRKCDRLHVLKRCLKNANLSANVINVQSIRSKESVFIQMTDFLIGIASERLNQKGTHGSAKQQAVQYLEELLKRKIAPTALSEKKFNIFKINLQGGW